MLMQATGLDRNDSSDDRQRLVVATEAQPTPTASGHRRRSAAMSMAGKLKVRAAALHAISASLSSSKLSSGLRLRYGEPDGPGLALDQNRPNMRW